MKIIVEGHKTSTHLAGCLEKPKVVPQLLLAHGTRSIDFIAKHQKRHLTQVLNGE